MAKAVVQEIRDALAWVNRRRRAVLALLVGWAVVITIGAGASPGERNWIGLPSLEWLPYVVFGFMLIGAVIAIVALASAGKAEGPKEPPKRKVLPTLIMLAIFALLANFIRPEEQGEFVDEQDVPPPPEDLAADGASRSLDPVGLDGPDVAGIVLILLVALTALLWSRSRTKPEEEAEPAAADQGLERVLTPAVDRAAVQLRDAADPRTAVLLSYRELELTIERHGHPRRDTETAVEHLQRVLRAITIDTGPLLDLAGLYELARFSHQPITAADQDRAATSLELVAAQLAVER